jgi:hypothetical protein
MLSIYVLNFGEVRFLRSGKEISGSHNIFDVRVMQAADLPVSGKTIL